MEMVVFDHVLTLNHSDGDPQLLDMFGETNNPEKLEENQRFDGKSYMAYGFLVEFPRKSQR